MLKRGLAGGLKPRCNTTKQEQDNAAASLRHSQMLWFAKTGEQMAGKKRIGKRIHRAKQDEGRDHIRVSQQ